MSAHSIVTRAAKVTATKRARDNGHSLSAWQNGHSTTWARCYVCGAEVTVVRANGSISGPALQARCKAVA